MHGSHVHRQRVSASSCTVGLKASQHCQAFRGYGRVDACLDAWNMKPLQHTLCEMGMVPSRTKIRFLLHVSQHHFPQSHLPRHPFLRCRPRLLPARNMGICQSLCQALQLRRGEHTHLSAWCSVSFNFRFPNRGSCRA